MHANERVLIVAELVLGVLGALSIITGQTQLATIALTAAASVLAGHLNGRQND